MSAFAREATVELSSEWDFSTDPDDVGIEEEWYSSMTTLPDAWSVDIPHVWQEHETLREYTGAAWYRRSFSPEPSVERVLLRFGAVDYEATVWVNGTEIGANRGGYLPFQFDITDALRAGENTVAVRVHDPEDLRQIPHGKQGQPWYTRVSGIWQPVTLAEVPETYLSSAQATPDLDSDTVTIAVETNDTTDEFRARVSVTQDSRTLGSASGLLTAGTGKITVDLDDPAYWTPETPNLCDFEVKLATENDVLDTYSDYFGMRTIAIEDGKWYLNGEPFSVRGALDQAYYPDTFSRPSGSISYREEIETAMDIGFNMLRKHIKPAHPEFVEWADRCGLLVWEEPANPDMYTERSKREVRQQFERLVGRDYNRPSVVVWSLYNEEWGIGLDLHDSVGVEHPTRLWNDEDKQAYLASFYDDAHELDPTRLVCDNSGWAHVRTDVNDYHEYFIVPDRADAWQERLETIVADPGDNYATTSYDVPEDTPIVVSEFGTWGLPNIERLRDHYGGDPHWFEHDFLEGLKQPAGIDTRFAESALSDAFEDLPSLARAWQRRALKSIETLLRDMRTTERFSGYVITEFTDVEWEFNGILDYLREPKTELVDGFAAVNAAVTGWAAPHDHVHWDDDSLIADLVVVNDTTEATTVTVEWEAFGRSGTQAIEMAANETERVTGAIDVALPSVDTPRTEHVTVRLPNRDVTVTSEVVVVPRSSAPDVAVAADNEALSDALAQRGYELVDSETADVTIGTKSVGDPAGDTLILPDATGELHVGSVDGISVTELPERESWNLCASFVSQTLFEQIDIVPGWAFEDLYPYAYIVTDTTDDVTVAYAEGWLANYGAISLTRATDTGRLGVCSLRLTDSYGEHPMATAVVDRLLEQFM